MSIQSLHIHAANTGNYAYRCLPTVSNLLRNCQKVALPAVALAAMGYLPAANAGPIIWYACIVTCETAAAAATAATGGAAAGTLLACVAACAPLLALPFPP